MVERVKKKRGKYLVAPEEFPLSPLQERWVVNRVKEGENIWWPLKNPPSPPSGEMGGEQG